MTQEYLVKIIEGVFLHGKETPDKPYDLPEGQYTIHDAIKLINQYVAEVIGEDEWKSKTVSDFVLYYRDELRAEQRKRAGIL